MGPRIQIQKLTSFEKRRQRVRTGLRAKGGARPRLSVHRSGRHIYAQVIDDAAGKTVAAASTVEKDARKASGANVDAAVVVGKAVAELQHASVDLREPDAPTIATNSP